MSLPVRNRLPRDEGARERSSIARRAPDREALAGEWYRPVGVARRHEDLRLAVEQRRAHERRDVVCPIQCPFEPCGPLAEVPMRVPEPPQRARERRQLLVVARRCECLEGGPKIRVVDLEPLEPGRLVSSEE